jgi:hypothetical protein
MINDTISELSNAIDDFLNADLQSIRWDYKPAPGKWSSKEIIGHLIDSASINLQRFVRCTYEESFILTYDQVEWVHAQLYQEAEVDELLSLWRSLSLQIIRVLKNYPTERLRAKCNNSKTELSLHTVEWLAQDYTDHL